MNNIKAQTLKGFRDFLPQEVRKRAWLKQQMIAVFEKWGFEPLETPTLESLDLFEGQIGEDEKLFYKFQDQGDRWVALRYDQTVPSCRVIGQYYNELVFPFRRYQIQSNFRAEKPQRGRYREFVQADIDIFGVKSPNADAECIAVSLDLYRSLGFKKVIVLVNNRNLLQGIPYPAISSVDKLKKIGPEGVIEDMKNKGISEELAKEYLNKIENLKPDEMLNKIFTYLKTSGFPEDSFQFEPTLARSFSYSEGPIWEIVVPEYSAGSLGGGERYDSMLANISGRDIGATGIAFGFDRTLEALELCNLLPDFESETKVLVTIFSPDLADKSLEISSNLRSNNINCELWLDPESKLEKQLKYADQKSIPFTIIIGPEEVKENKVVLKNLKERTQVTLSLDAAIQKLTS